MRGKVEVLASILAADCSCLASEVKRMEQAGIRAWHVDVMDGHFVPNITMGPMWVEALRRHSDKLIDVHLMIYNPFEYIERFVAAGADRITFHVEATEDVEETISFIRSCGKRVGLAISPETSVESLRSYLAHIDLALVMTVNPGFGGQNFQKEMLEKVEYLSKIQKQHDLVQAGDKNNALLIQVDGGINDTSAKEALDAGATSLVAGTYLLKADDPKKAIDSLCLR